MSSVHTKRLIYRGPVQQVCYELSAHGYSAILVPDAVYELPADFADALLRSNANFQVAPTSSFSFSGLLKDAQKGFVLSAGEFVPATSSDKENQ